MACSVVVENKNNNNNTQKKAYIQLPLAANIVLQHSSTVTCNTRHANTKAAATTSSGVQKFGMSSETAPSLHWTLARSALMRIGVRKDFHGRLFEFAETFIWVAARISMLLLPNIYMFVREILLVERLASARVRHERHLSGFKSRWQCERTTTAKQAGSATSGNDHARCNASDWATHEGYI